MNTSQYRSALGALLVLTSLLLLSCGGPAGTTSPLSPLDTPTRAPTAAGSPGPVEQPTSLPGEPPTPSFTPAATDLVSTPTLAVAAAALVNGQPVVLDDYESQVALAMESLDEGQTFDPSTEEGKAATLQLRRQILDAMIDQVLIEQAAARVGITISDEQVESEIARLIGEDLAKFEEWLEANGLTRDSFKVQLRQQLLGAAFQEHVVGSLPPKVEQVHARHILVATEAEAMDILVRLRAGEGFAALAKQYSQDKASSEAGGDLGFFPRRVMPIQIEAVAFALAPGQRSGIVATDFGYHIIEVLEKNPAREVPEDMLPVWRQNTFMHWLDTERLTANIQYLIPID